MSKKLPATLLYFSPMRQGALALVVAVVGFGWAASVAGGSYPGADGRIAFTRTTNHGYEAAIYAIDPDGSDLKLLTSTGKIAAHPAYSPDGSQIAFERDGEIWVMGAAGESPQRLTDPRRYIVDTEPSWSPDGKRLVFVRSGKGSSGDADLWTVDSDGSALHRVARTKHLDERWPAWSPDGRLIAFTNVKPRAGIYTVNVHGRHLETVDASRQQPFDFDWSPDGKRIALVRANGGRAQLLVVDSDGSGEHRLARTKDKASSPAFSPSGRSIAFTVGATLNVVDADGGKPHALLERPHNGADFDATWQPLP
jgi:Tol biopolymer transport system component